MSTIAGSGVFGFSGDNGPAVNAAFRSPESVTSDSAGNIYVADTGNHRIRKIDLSGVVTTIAVRERAPVVLAVSLETAKPLLLRTSMVPTVWHLTSPVTLFLLTTSTIGYE